MSLKLAVLGLLDVEPGSGYALLQRFRTSLGFFWQTTHQQLYKELHGLHEEGLVDCETVSQETRPDKKVYSLNARGAAELDALLTKAATPTKIRDPLLVKIFCGRRLGSDALRAEVESHRRKHEQTLALYRMLHEQIGKRPAAVRQRYHHPELTLRLGIRFEEAWLAWCEEIGAEL
ncbi:PadR family transcriptional regulator [Solimonas terrae]|uniref:PadR family transcriptional regulator n=1 Tax=Solimonas terrae TaxID=1396819 RepID=A0A6M2BP11_9GAMM|nr:PadR family transcriptional regulator [Solimonas terrae]NGY04060.1 PadR family transcriptional regulator [Solimonas terrae]